MYIWSFSAKLGDYPVSLSNQYPTHAQLLRNLRQPARFGNNLIPVSISSGAIHAAASHYQAKRLLEQGDSAMYTAKTSQLTDIVWFNDMTEEDQAALLNL